MSKFALLLHHAPDRYTRLSEDDAMTIFKDSMHPLNVDPARARIREEET